MLMNLADSRGCDLHESRLLQTDFMFNLKELNMIITLILPLGLLSISA